VEANQSRRRFRLGQTVSSSSKTLGALAFHRRFLPACVLLLLLILGTLPMARTLSPGGRAVLKNLKTYEVNQSP
jgi:hypothetical protein